MADEKEVKVVEITLKNKSTARQTYFDDKGKGVSIMPGEVATFSVPEAVRDDLKNSELVEFTTKSAAEAERKKEAADEEAAAKKQAAEEAAAASKRK